MPKNFDQFFTSGPERLDSTPDRPRLNTPPKPRVEQRPSGPERSAQEQVDIQKLIAEQMVYLKDKSQMAVLLNADSNRVSGQIEFMTRPLKGDAKKIENAEKALKKIYDISQQGKQNERRAA